MALTDDQKAAVKQQTAAFRERVAATWTPREPTVAALAAETAECGSSRVLAARAMAASNALQQLETARAGEHSEHLRYLFSVLGEVRAAGKGPRRQSAWAAAP